MKKNPKTVNLQSFIDSTYPGEKTGQPVAPLAVDLLPAVFQTDTNKKIFGAAIEQMFQPAAIENLNYYVGRPDGSSQSGQEFLPRINSRRQFETGLIVDRADGTRVLTADDIAIAQGHANNHIQEPAVPVSVLDLPINPDKFVNWSNYYWVEEGMPTLYIVGPEDPSEAFDIENDIIGKQHYTLPIQLNGKLLELKNGMRLVFLKDYPNRSSIAGNSSETHIADGSNQLDFSHEMTQGYDKNVITVQVNGIVKTRLGAGSTPDYTFTLGSIIWLPGKAPPVGATVEIDLPDYWVSSSISNSVNNVRLADRRWQVSGVGTATGIKLLPRYQQTARTIYSSQTQSLWDQTSIPWDRIAWDSDVTGINDKHYVLLANDAPNISAFSRVNVWVHKDTIQAVCNFLDLSFEDIVNDTKQALRPIVEFDHRLELYNHGVRYRHWVDTVVDRELTLIPTVPGRTGLDVFLGHSVTTLLVHTMFGSIENTFEDGVYLFDRIIDGLEKVLDTDQTVKAEGTAILNEIVESFGNDSAMVREIINNIILLLTDTQNGNLKFLARRVLWLNNDVYKNKIITFKTNISNVVNRYEIESANNGDAVVVRPASGPFSMQEFYWVGAVATSAQTRLSKTQKPLFRIYDRNQIALDQWEAVYGLRPNKLWSTIVEINEGTVLDTESGYKFTFLPTQFRSLSPNSPQATAMYDALYKHTLQDTVSYLDTGNREQQIPSPLNFRRLRSPITDQSIDLNGGLSFGYRRAWFRLRSWASNIFDLSKISSENDSVGIALDSTSWPLYEWNIAYAAGNPVVLHTDNLENTIENILVGAVGENLVLNTIWVSSIKLINPNTGQVLLDKVPDSQGQFKFAIPVGIAAGFYNLKLNNDDNQILRILLINIKVDPRAPIVKVNGLDADYTFETTRNLTNDVTAFSVKINAVDGLATLEYQGEFISGNDHATALPGIEYNSLQDINLKTFSPGRLMQGMFKNIQANAVNTTEVWTAGTQIPALNGSLMTDISDLRSVWLQHRAEPTLNEVLINRSTSSWRWYRKFAALLERHYKIYDFENESARSLLDRLLDELSIGLNYSLPDAISGMAFSTNAMNSKQYVANGSQTVFEINTGSEPFYQGIFGPDHVYVYVDDLLQDNTSYNIVNNTVVFDTAPVNTAVVEIYHGNAEAIYTGIPASPSKLGLKGVFQPQLIRETWGTNERILIQRHDGSKTLAYQTDWTAPADLRDQVILELENRIYTGCLYRNGDLERQLLNRFSAEFLPATAPRSRALLQWLNSNNIDYRDRSDFDASDPWTWNYNGKSWRAIYLENFGTTQLHLAPWESLGYHQKPTWWDANYSWTDPTKRSALESALSMGRVGNPGIINEFNFDFRVRRQNPLGYPIDSSGNLIDPVAWGIPAPSADEARQPWELNSYGPAEDAWLRSSAGAWATVIDTAATLATSNEFVERSINPYASTNQNNSPSSIGATTFAPNSFTQLRPTIGIGAVLFEANREVNLLGESVLEELGLINPILQFGVGGYSDQSARFQMYNTRYQTGSYVPEEDFLLVLNDSVPVDRLRYSAVRLEKDDTGFRVYGYDPEQHYFTVYTPNKLRAGTGLTQRIVTTPTGEYVQWLNWNSEPVAVPYGTLFADKQSLYEFFLGIGEYQSAQGLIFDQPNNRGAIDDWNQAAIDSFEWIAENWSSEHYVIVSPAGVASGFKIEHATGQLDRLDADLLRQGKIILSNNTVAKNSDLLITRNYDTNIDFIQPLNNKQILFAQIALRNYDHVFYFNSKTRFGDVLVDFQSNQRLDYLKLVARRSRNWNGRMQAPGSLPVARGVLPGFDALTTDIVESRRPEKSQYNTFYGELSKSSVVPSTASILSEVIADSSVEFQYRQGLKRATGTNLSFDAFFRNASIDFPGSDQNLNVNEQWLFKTGEFGRLGDRKVWEIELRAKDVKSDRQAIRFIEGATEIDLQSDNIIDLIGKNDSRWVTRDYQNVDFSTISRSTINKTTTLNENWLPNAGVANLDQVKAKSKSIDSLTTREGLEQVAGEDISRLLEIRSFNKFVNYKPEDIVWHEGNLYKCTAFVVGGQDTAFDPIDWVLFNSSEPAVAAPANIWLSDYNFENSTDLPADSDSVGWTVLQLVGPKYIEEVCPNALVPNLNESKVTFADPHGLNDNDVFLITGSGDGNYDKFHTVKKKVDDYNVLIAARSTSGAIAYDLVAFTLKSMKFGSVASLTSTLPPATSGLAEGTVAYVETEANKEYRVYRVENNTWVLDNEYTTENKSMVNTKLIDNVKILDAKTEELLATVEVFDPFKGLTVDEVAQYIDFNDGVDPATYNIDDLGQEDLDATNPWGANRIGTLWWDTSQVRYLEYEQGPIDYRINHWGEQFEDSRVVVYEWTRSEVLPSTLDTPDARLDMSNGIGFVRYSELDEENPVTGEIKTYYYYWKATATTLPENTTRPYSAADIQATLNNPSAAGVTWMSPIDSNAFIIANIRSFLNARDSVIVRIEQKQFAEQQHENGILVSEGVGGDLIPEYLYRRLAAGVVGYDNYRKSYNLKFWTPGTEYKVGDYVINWSLSTTIQSSNYQGRDIPILLSLDHTRDDVTSFRRPTITTGDTVDLMLHRAFYVTANHTSGSTFKQDVIDGKLANSGASAVYVDSFSPTGYSAVVESRRRVPDSRLHPLRRYGNAYVPVPQTWYRDIKEARRNLVYSANRYLLEFPAVNKEHWNAHLLEYRPLFGSYTKDVTPYWSYVDYQAPTYTTDSEQIFVNDHSEVQQYEVDNPDVEITRYGLIDSNGVLQQSFDRNGTDTTLIYQRNGTIQFNDVVWNGSLDGWDTARWDLNAWDEDNSEIVENILVALREDLFVSEDVVYFNLFFFDMIKESLRQIPNASWVTKTTYLNINNQSSNELRPLAHYYDRKNILVSSYINEVKPYHSKISDLNQNLENTETVAVSIEETLNLIYAFLSFTVTAEDGDALTDENGNILEIIVNTSNTSESVTGE